MSDSNRDPDDIQADIARTRGRLDETLSAIERRLEPSRLMDQGVDYLRNHGAKTYFVNLGETAKQQPLPLALVGLAVLRGEGSGMNDKIALLALANLTT